MVPDPKCSEPSAASDLLRWLNCTLAFELLPLAFHCLYLRATSPPNASIWATVQSTLADGDLFLINCCVGGIAVGERAGRQVVRPRTEFLLVVWCVLDLLLSVFFYTLSIAQVVRNTGTVATLSIEFFILTVIPSATLMLITFKSTRSRND